MGVGRFGETRDATVGAAATPAAKTPRGPTANVGPRG